MSIITVKGISKKYQLGVTIRHDTMRDKIAEKLFFFKKNKINPTGKDRESKDYFWALKDINFEVQKGDVFGVIGRNGAGKSTLLKILSRITEPTEGEIHYRGRMGSLLEVGTGFHPELTGRENVFLNGSILGMRKEEIRKKFDEIVAFAEVEQFLDTPVKRYSSGMYVRLAFSVAAHFEPEILIIDEVLSVGDIGFQKKCLGKMQNVAGQGRTVLFVSHNMAAVRSLCNKSILIEKGKIEAAGSTDAVLDQYLEENAGFGAMKQGQRIESDADRGPGFVLNRKSTNGSITFLCGKPLVMEFEVATPRPLDQMNIGITIVNMLGTPIVSMSSKVQNVSSKNGPSTKWAVHCDLGQFPLNAGTYSSNLYVGDGIRDVAKFSDAFSFHVLPNDVFGWGNELPNINNWGAMYWAPKWDIHPE